MKPPYVIPSMEEIAKIKGTNGYTVVSTFSGCGGACLGFEMDGYEILYANEFVEQARITYAANHETVHLDGRDIRIVTGEDILQRIGKKPGEVDVLEGSPPCASFSTAGSREKGWGRNKKYSDTTQRADDLFFEYSRVLGEIQPKVFTAENVSGLVKGKAIGYFKEILTDLRTKGYVVEAKVLDASWLGVPQARQRLIFIGVRNDVADKYGLRPVFPKPLSHQYTIEDVLRLDEKQSHDLETGQDIRLDKYAIGPEWDKLLPGEQSKKYFQLVKADVNKPIGTITATAGGIGAAGSTHPTQKRKFTLGELRLLGSFPADFILTGNYAQRWERIGRSVPPLMARAIAQTIRTEILDKIK
jgi:DNA (cytosine-5)-methyltransferase 1